MANCETKIEFPDRTNATIPTGLLINGTFTPAADNSVFETINPYTQKPICSIARGKAADIDAAVNAARNAFPTWKASTPAARGKLLLRLAELIERDVEVLAKLEAVDGGKPVQIAKDADVRASAECLRYYAGWADKVKGSTTEVDSGSLNMTLKEPYGVCGLIIPWNFPLLICSWKLGPSLAVGNTVVLKPAELTPLSALYVGKLTVEAGFPPGVVNIVPGFGGEAGAALATHPHVNKISFTGSTSVGRELLRASAASNLKKITLELGGKSPSVVFESADLDRVVEYANGGIFYNMGQNCCAGSRIYVQESIYEKFLEKFVARARQNVAGSPFAPNTFLGPQISAKQHAQIMEKIDTARTEGAVCVSGGTNPSGWFVEPTIFRDATQSMSIMHEEVFGPVVAVAPFKTLEDGIRLANDSSFGLAAAVFTSNVTESMAMAKALEAGTVWVNCYNAITHQLPFGGWKASGNGRDLGEDALAEFTQTKTVRFML